MDGMMRKDRTVDGVPTSLCDLGYCDVGLDDNWQQCSTTRGGLQFHDEDGTPLVNTDRFPDMAAMTAHAHKLGLTAGWYGNNCICSERKTAARRFYEGDVKAMRGCSVPCLLRPGSRLTRTHPGQVRLRLVEA